MSALARLDRAEGIGTITLDRPGFLNALNVEMAETLSGLVDEAASDSSIRVVVIRGAGPGFCAGGDVQAFADNLDDMGGLIGALLGAHHRALLALRTMPKLVVTSIHGATAGAGFSLAFMGDFCIAAESTRLRPAYAQLGVSPDGGGTVGLVAAVGSRRAMAIYLADDELALGRAHELGLVTKIVPDAELEAETTRFAARLAAIPSEAAAATKALLQRGESERVAAQLEAEKTALLECMKSDAFRARVRGFLAKAD